MLAMILETLAAGPLQANCIILGDEDAAEAIVIDPGGETERIHRRLKELGLKVKQILITHAHLDHVGGASALKQLTGAPILMNEDDLPLLGAMRAQAVMFGVAMPPSVLPDENLPDGLTVGLARYPGKVIHTPGHSPGSVCLYFASLKLLISGDTLFAGSIGRTDLPGGDHEQIVHSLRTRLLPLPDDTRVLPGHGPETTIGQERSNNVYLSEKQVNG